MVKVLNALLKMRIMRGGKVDRVLWEPAGVVLQLADTPGTTEAGQGGPSRGNRVRLKICDAETGEVQIWEVEGRRVG